MKFLMTVAVLISTAHLFAQQSNINIENQSGVELFEGSKICVDDIVVDIGSSFIAYDYGQVRGGDCNSLVTPTGGGTVTLPVEISDIESLPLKFTIMNAYPNPFNPTTSIRYGIPSEGRVVIRVYDVIGRLINTLYNDIQQAGWYEITWNGISSSGELASSGTYIYQIEAGYEIKTNKISFVK